ncbi:SMP-30/gluconolactonase/LRE family protein [Solimonas terrae]|uniref:SMP-30/Gluconolactonase/LRE-like region domain-containing protein n=1 Tax=Solimonas terrae TaxID=1396819 RepID=A0A6M2BTK7_9GAMM|nr:hypothetical protein [Solimonas terrae]NGY05339.1 hypothetical protein [Solimonas terrae]
MNKDRRNIAIRTWFTCGFLFVAACSSDRHTEPGGSGATIDPASLCVASDCGEKTVLLTIPSAENLLFADDGRLFVSGGTNVFEISRTGDGYAATPLYDGSCNFTGLAIVGDVLYANCFDGRLYAAQLGAHPALQPIHDLGLGAPNGLAADADGALYLVNGPLSTSSLPAPKIVRLLLDPQDPFHVIDQSDWTSAGLLGPNGLQIHDGAVYVSNTGLGGLGEIRRYPIEADGSAGTGTQFASLPSVPDDFSFVGDEVLVAYYGTGQIALLDADGQPQSSTAVFSFSFPSQVKVGKPPLFSADDLLVTEKGILGDNSSPIGNRLSLFRRKPGA